MSYSVNSNWVQRLSLLLILFATSGCATALIAPVNSYCAIARPIGYDGRADTPATVAAVEAHNSQWACVCEKDCPLVASVGRW